MELENASKYLPTDQKKQMLVDDWLEKVAKQPKIKYVVFIMSSVLVWGINSFSVLISVFSGLLPEDGEWKCLNSLCRNLVTENTTLYTVCELLYTSRKLELGEDIIMEPKRTSFAVDFEMFCGDVEQAQNAKKTLISSIYFAGSFLGLLTGGVIYDSIGRKKSFFVGNLVAIAAVFSGTFCNSYNLLLVIRFFQGYGNLLAETAVYILSMELVPARHRNLLNGFIQSIWCMGYLVGSLISYLITNWNYLFLSCSIVLVLISIPVIFIIESPRYCMIRGDKDGAKRAIWKLAGLNEIKINREEIVIADETHLDDEVATLQQVKEFLSYPILVKETLIQMFVWSMISMSYYGFSFGWQEIIPDVYIGYILAAAGETMAYVLGGWLIAHWGRRSSMIIFFLGCIITFLLAMINLNLGRGWKLESVICLISSSFVSAAFSGIYLYTSELAPTSHRGMVFAFSSSSGRIGSFLGPFVITNLRDIVGKWLSFGLLILLGMISLLGMLYLVDTHLKKIPDTPAEVKERRKEYKLKFW